MSDAETLADVPDAELSEAIRYCAEKIGELRKSGLSLPSVCKQIGVRESGLKQLLSRAATEGGSALRRGAVFSEVFAYFKREERKQEFTDQSLIRSILTALPSDDDTRKSIAYSLMMHMLNISGPAQDRAASKTFKRLYCFRNAVNSDYVVKSELIFTRLTAGDEILPAAWEFHHRYVDNNGVGKRSDGVSLVINNNIYLIGDIQNGEGLDIIVLREAVDNADFMIGFHVSVDDHRPFFANMVFFDADRYDALESELTHFDGSGEGRGHREKTGILVKVEMDSGAILKSQKLAASLRDQLNIEGSKGVLRIKQRFLIPNFAQIRAEYSETT